MNDLDVTPADKVLALRLLAAAWRDDDYQATYRDVVFLEAGRDPASLYRLLIACAGNAMGAVIAHNGGQIDRAYKPTMRDLPTAEQRTEFRAEALATELLFCLAAVHHAEGDEPAADVDAALIQIFKPGDPDLVRAVIAVMVQLTVVHRLRLFGEGEALDCETAISALLDDPRTESTGADQ